MSLVPGRLTPRPDEPDIHLALRLHGFRFDYIACRTAALAFAAEWRVRTREQVTIIPGQVDGLPRLPCEELYLDGTAVIGSGDTPKPLIHGAKGVPIDARR
ncbi:hypothetical protein [Nocardia sp. NPDC024068]|uniref:hypothetical protein n=1 Tax=Nocardia sp. NPDC024068 TaxID=3157197 RepID=UPI0033FACCCD